VKQFPTPASMNSGSGIVTFTRHILSNDAILPLREVALATTVVSFTV